VRTFVNVTLYLQHNNNKTIVKSKEKKRTKKIFKNMVEKNKGRECEKEMPQEGMVVDVYNPSYTEGSR
jgi:hypothetical protein